MTCVLVLTILAARLFTGDPSATTDTRPQDAAATSGERLMRDPAIRSAVERLQRDEPSVLDDQMRLCEIPAPPFRESARAAA